MAGRAPLASRTSPSDEWDAVAAGEETLLETGIVHTVHDAISPLQARIADLLLTAAALKSAGIELLLIRHEPSVPALVVDAAQRGRATAALAAMSLGEPVYAKPQGRPPVPVAELPGISPEPAVLRVFRPRVTRDGSLRYGASLGARVEFWHFRDDIVEAPSDNVLTRRILASTDVRVEVVEQYGRRWRTIRSMFDPHPDEFREDVDLVFSWVDGSSSDFQRQRAARLAGYVVGEGDGGPARYRHVDELRYALRSVHMYAPWVRRIFIATDSPTPAWLLDHPAVTLIRSEEIFADPTVLPTHNSHAVESQLHRIPGLSEHFLYANDDMFFARPVEPGLFFSAAGVTKFVESSVRIGVGDATAQRSGHDNALRRNRELLRERLDITIVRDLEHCVTPLRRSVMAELEAVFPEEFAQTAAARFRSATDVSVTNSLYHYYALMTGRAVSTTQPRVAYVETTARSALRRMSRLAGRRDLDMFCINDGGTAELPEEVRIRAVREALDRMFPIPAPWERGPVSAATLSAP